MAFGLGSKQKHPPIPMVAATARGLEVAMGSTPTISHLPEREPRWYEPAATRRRLLLAALSVLLMTSQACAVEATYRGRLEVWNRTETPIKVVGRDASFEVPACGHVVQGQFVLNRYDIVDSQGRFVARHGGGGSNPASVTPAYEMVTSAGAVYSDLHPPAEPLPDCRGAVQGQ